MIDDTFDLDTNLGNVTPNDNGGSIGVVVPLSNNPELTRDELVETLTHARLQTKLEMTGDDGDTPSLYQGPIASLCTTRKVGCSRKAGNWFIDFRLNFDIDEEHLSQLLACRNHRARLVFNRQGDADEKPEKPEFGDEDTHQLGIADGIEIASLNGVNDVNADKLAALQITTMGDLYRSLHVGNRFDSYGLSEAAIKALRAKLADLGLEEPTPTETPAEAA
ncbi:MAG: hypothetical protein AAGI54_08230 [Planctomycetota bacterium]